MRIQYRYFVQFILSSTKVAHAKDDSLNVSDVDEFCRDGPNAIVLHQVDRSDLKAIDRIQG